MQPFGREKLTVGRICGRLHKPLPSLRWYSRKLCLGCKEYVVVYKRGRRQVLYLHGKAAIPLSSCQLRFTIPHCVTILSSCQEIITHPDWRCTYRTREFEAKYVHLYVWNFHSGQSVRNDSPFAKGGQIVRLGLAKASIAGYIAPCIGSQYGLRLGTPATT